MHGTKQLGGHYCLERTESTTHPSKFYKSKTKDSLEQISSVCQSLKEVHIQLHTSQLWHQNQDNTPSPLNSMVKPWSNISKRCHLLCPLLGTKTETGPKCKLLMKPVILITPPYNCLQTFGKGLKRKCMDEALAVVRWLSRWALEMISGSWRNKFHGDLPSSTSNCSNMLLKKQFWNLLRETGKEELWNRSLKLWKFDHHALLKAEGLGLLCRWQK